jgi:hypothetical protein
MNTCIIEATLAKKIQEAVPSINIEGADRKVFQVALQDLTNYMTYVQNQNVPIEQTSFEEISSEFDSFLTVWTGMWLKKWNQRFSLLIGENKQKTASPSKSTEEPAKCPAKIEDLACREELTQLLINTLIQRSEISGTTIIAENILQKEVQKFSACDMNTKENTFKLLNNALTKIREIAQSNGPVVLVKVEKEYYCQAN